MKIAILYICTGRYTRFWEGFYRSCEQFFLPDVEKEYFVFTDDMKLCREDNVHLIFKECQGFPKDSLFRFDMFLNVKNELERFDYIFFLNSNAEFRKVVTSAEILPDNETGLVGADWPGRRKPAHWPMFFPYERNKRSTAYVPPRGKDFRYYMGGINGGTSKAYLAMIETLAANIRKDYEAGIVALVHDESHINKYFRLHKPKSLSEEYCWPEEWPSDFSPKMVFRDKVRLDPYFNKGRDQSLTGKIKKAGQTLLHAVRWYI